MAKKNSTKTKKTKPKVRAPAQSDMRPEVLPPDEPRRIRPGAYDSFRLQKRVRKFRTPISGAPTLLYRALKLLFANWKLFGGIIFIYLLLELALVQGLSLVTSGSSLTQTKQLLDGVTNIASATGSMFLLLIGNGTGNTSSAAYQFMLLLFISLVLIWALRQRYMGGKARIRDAFYRGPAQFVPFFLVLLMLAVDLIPGVIGVMLYTAVSNNGIAGSYAEHVLWGIVVGILAVVSLYYITGTIFALYVVSLSEMTPVRAIRLASQLVRERRLVVMVKVIFIPIAIFIMMALLIVPFLLFAVKIAPVAFFVGTALMVAVLHAYLYGLYRELLNE